MGFLQQYQCLHPSAAKAPHFSRLGDVEVNAGQNATFQCVAAGKAAEAERFLMQVSNGGGETSIFAVNPMHRSCNTSVPPLWEEKNPLGRGEKGNPPRFLSRRHLGTRLVALDVTPCLLVMSCLSPWGRGRAARWSPLPL